VRSRVKMIVRGLQQFVLSPLLPAAAVMLIALFTVSLALADPHAAGAQVLASPSYATAIAEDDALLSDSITEADAAIVSTPLPAPYYHDRYRFYHRYDLAPRSRFNPLDDGVN
jgi:hypothetical protein